MLTPAQSSLFQEVHTYISSPEGQARIHQALQRHRLPTALDADLEEAVISEALRFITRGHEITSAPGWCNARFTARAIDLSRGIIRKRHADEELLHLADTHPLDDALDDADFGVNDTRGPLDDASAHPAALAGWRREVLATAADPLDVCAVLTTISVLAENVPLAENCPQPQAGATPEEAACWAGLWYAKRTECFGVGNTTTKRRSRANKRLKQILRTALPNPELKERA